MNIRGKSAIALACGALTLAACGTSSKATPVDNVPVTPTSAATSPPIPTLPIPTDDELTPSPTPTPTPTPSDSHVGATLRADGGDDLFDITLDAVIDPASGESEYATPDAGKRFVAAKFTIKSNDTDTISDNANNDATITGSDNQKYRADFNSISGCTNFDSGNVRLDPGDTLTGCVAFQLPEGVTAAKITYDTSGGFGNGSVGIWLNP